MSVILFKNARLVDPTQNLDSVGDLLCEDGKITKLGQNIEAPNEAKVVDATHLVLAPGFIDLHVHLRDPGFTQKEDVESGCNAAAAGGVTTLCAMPNTAPTCDSPKAVQELLEKAKSAKAHVIPVAAITKGLRGEELTDMKALVEAGAGAFSDDGVPVATARLMADAMEQAAALNTPIFAHTEDRTLSKGGVIHDGISAKELGVIGIPSSAEDVGTAREIALLMSAPKGCHLHICHTSTKISASLIRDAKAKGYAITAETCPHYFIFDETKVLTEDADYRMNPPLRTKEDKEAIFDAIVSGDLDVIATDHAPHTVEEKSDFYHAPNGVIGMETSFSASYTALVASGKLTLSELIYRMSAKPAEILGIDAGTLKVGSPADLVLLDENETWVVDPEKLHGKSKNAVFKNYTLQSKVKMTVLDGKIVFEDERKDF